MPSGIGRVPEQAPAPDRPAAGHSGATGDVDAPTPEPRCPRPRAYAAGFSPPLILIEALFAASCSVLVER